MSTISQYSDRTPKIKLANKRDIEYLEARAAAAEVIANQNRKIEQYKAEIADEQSRRYPSIKFIESRQRAIETIQACIATYHKVRG